MTRPVKAKLATLDQLDGRTAAARQVRKTISAIESDHGGRDQMTEARIRIAETAAVTTAMVNDMAAKWLNGEDLDFNRGLPSNGLLVRLIGHCVLAFAALVLLCHAFARLSCRCAAFLDFRDALAALRSGLIFGENYR
jgi:hypothetical protein